MPLSASQLYQGAVHHALAKAPKGREREYALFFIRVVANDLRERKMYSSALVASRLLQEMYDTKKILGLEQKYGLCEHCYKLPKLVAHFKNGAKPPERNTGATQAQLDTLEGYV